MLDKALDHQLSYLPAGALVVVIDDGSTMRLTLPEGLRLIRCDMSCGIVASKNASIEALIDAGYRAPERAAQDMALSFPTS